MLQEDFVQAYIELAETDQEQPRYERFAKKLVQNQAIWGALTHSYLSEKLDPFLGNLDRHKKFVFVFHTGLEFMIIQKEFSKNPA